VKRVRFVPSPSRTPHVGNALGAVANPEVVLAPPVDHVSLDVRGVATLARFRELREGVNGGLDFHGAKALLRELKAVGGDLRTLRRTLTGRERGAELAAIVAALDRDETLRRIDAAL
jgi:glutamyl/glutaminyl-tRNA synthetase